MVVAYTSDPSRHTAMAGMEKTRKRKKADVPLALASKGWKKIDVGDELLLGSEEGGFLELEELSPAATNSQPAAAAAADVVSEHTATGTASAVKSTKQKKGRKDDGSRQTAMEGAKAVKAEKKGKRHASKDEGAAADVEDLKAKIAALQQENAALKYAVMCNPFPTLRCSNKWCHSVMHARKQASQAARPEALLHRLHHLRRVLRLKDNKTYCMLSLHVIMQG